MSNNQLPIDYSKTQIITAVSHNRTTIVSGETGCGKSTSIPVFLYQLHKGQCRIICTQPRRVACINIATRVAKVLNVTMGEEVGYHIGMDTKFNSHTKILFVTTGIMLNYLLHDHLKLQQVNYIILDEVHERDLDLDFVFLLTKCLMSEMHNFKIVLMSATINASIFAGYFGTNEIRKERLLTIALGQDFNQDDYKDELKETEHPYEELEELSIKDSQNQSKSETFQLTKKEDFDDPTLHIRHNFDPHALQHSKGEQSNSYQIKRVKEQTPNPSISHSPNVGIEPRRPESIKQKDETTNTQKYKHGFLQPYAPIITIYAHKDYWTKTLFLEDFSNFFGFRPTSPINYSDYNLSKQNAQLIEEFVDISVEMIIFIIKNEQTVSSSLEPNIKVEASNTEHGKYKFLIFLPGLAEIYYYNNKLERMLEEHNVRNFEIILLHSQIQKNFSLTNFEPNKVYLLLATNIAESSITIPNVGYVFDFCLTKEQVIKDSRVGVLELVWTSKASSLQRKGRTGRMNNGYCFHMLNKRFFENLSEFVNPEINRIPLDKLILRTNVIFNELQRALTKKSNPNKNEMHGSLQTDFNDGLFDSTKNHSNEGYRQNQRDTRQIKHEGNQLAKQDSFKPNSRHNREYRFPFLALIFSSPYKCLKLALEPPEEAQIRDSVNYLLSIKAIRYRNEHFNLALTGYVPNQKYGQSQFNKMYNKKQCQSQISMDEEFDNTFFGKLYSELPCNVSLIKLIFYGRMFNCLDDCINLAAILNCRKSIFKFSEVSSPDDIEQFYNVIHAYDGGQNSDLIVMAKLYEEWENRFCSHLLDNASVRNVFQIKSSMKRMGGDQKRMHDWIKSRYLNLSSLFEILEQKFDLLKKIKQIEPTFFEKHTDGIKPLFVPGTDDFVICKYPELMPKVDAYFFSQSSVLKTENNSEPNLLIPKHETGLYNERLKFVFLSAFFPMVLRAYKKPLDEIRKEIAHVENNLKMNSVNTIKIQNSRLRKFLEDKKAESTEAEITYILQYYEKYVLAMYETTYGRYIKKSAFQNYEMFIEFHEEHAQQIIEKIRFIHNYFTQEKISAKVFSFKKGNYSIYVEDVAPEQVDDGPVKIGPKEEGDQCRPRQILTEEIEQMVAGFSKISYLHSLDFEDALEKKELFIQSNSINRNANLKKDTEELFFVAYEIMETMSRRYFCKGITLLPNYDSIFEIFILLFSPENSWKFSEFGAIELILYQGVQYNFKFWYDEEDLKEIRSLKTRINKFMETYEPIVNEDSYYKALTKLLTKQRKKFYFGERWLQMFRVFDQLDNSDTRPENPGLKIGQRQVQQKRSFDELYNQYIQWKRKLISHLDYLKKILHLSKSRLCCGKCQSRLFDACCLLPETQFGILRRVESRPYLLLKKLAKGSVTSNVVKDHEQFLDAVEVMGMTVTYYYFCQSMHLIGIGVAPPPSPSVPKSRQPDDFFYIPNFADLFLIHPDNSRQDYDNQSFRGDELLRREEQACVMRNRCLHEFVCHICEHDHPMERFDDAYSHFNSKMHIENEAEFRKIL
jgi:HrpA-like RNA helicase